MKAEKIIFDRNDEASGIAVFDETGLMEIDIYNENRALEGNVYLGRISKKISLANDRTGFMVNIGDGHEAFLNSYEPALKEANMNLDEIDAISCTYGPGLVGALLVGVSYAKALAYASNKPLVGTNHIEGHIAANYITHKDLKPPFLALVVSGGHTHLVHIKDYKEFEILGKTRDDAIGEAFDKVARVIGLGYPGGPKIDKLAKEGEANIKLPETHFENLDFSFSGIKTAVINLHHKNPDVNKADLAASFEKAVTDVLVENALKACEQLKLNTIVLAGGVSANSYIRQRFNELEEDKKMKIYYPEPILCTDNAAMIASAGYYNYINGVRSNLELNAVPNLKMWQ